MTARRNKPRSDQTQPTMRVRNWDELYENNRSRELKRTDWFPAPNDLSADSYVDLVGHERGAAHFGVWNAVLMVASRAKPRCGLLIKKDGRPHTAESLGSVTRLPAELVREAIDRLLDLRLIEYTEIDPNRSNTLRPHPGAGNPQEHATSPQEGAVEGKGTEHHHQEGNGTERKGTERADDQANTDGSSSNSSARSSRRKPPDEKQTQTIDADEKPITAWASPDDDLKTIYLALAGEHISISLLDAIRVNLESMGVTMAEFVEEVRKHKNNRLQNPAGFLRDLSKHFRTKTRFASPPVTAAEAEERDYKCSICGSSKRGEGLRLVDHKCVPCECASPEYIAHQRKRGTFAAEDSQQ